MSVTIVVGNPKAGSRTRLAAELVADVVAPGVPSAVVELADLGAELLDRSAERVAEARLRVAASRLVIVASPTYKGTYTGLLKLFLDSFAADELIGTTAIPLMLGADLRHSLAVEVALKPVLVEIGLSCPTRGLFLPEASHADRQLIERWHAAASRHLLSDAR